MTTVNSQRSTDFGYAVVDNDCCPLSVDQKIYYEI